MTKETCEIYYKQAKEKGDEKGMEFWKARAKLKGLIIQEEKQEDETKSKGKK